MMELADEPWLRGPAKALPSFPHGKHPTTGLPSLKASKAGPPTSSANGEIPPRPTCIISNTGSLPSFFVTVHTYCRDSARNIGKRTFLWDSREPNRQPTLIRILSSLRVPRLPLPCLPSRHWHPRFGADRGQHSSLSSTRLPRHIRTDFRPPSVSRCRPILRSCVVPLLKTRLG